MKLLLLFAVLFVLPPIYPRGVSAEEFVAPEGSRFYVSNALGLRLRALDPDSEETSEYLLVVARRNGVEISRLYHGGGEIKRWEVSDNEERIYSDGLLEEKRVLNSAGRLAEEQIYSPPGGGVLRRVVYRYSSKVLEAAETYDGQGNLLSSDRYRVSPKGRLLEVRRDGSGEEARRLNFKSWEGRIVEEIYSRGTEEYLYRYDSSGRPLGKEVWRDGEVVSREQYRYAGDASQGDGGYAGDVLPGDVPAGTVAKLLDEVGRVIRQTRYELGKLVEEFISYDEAGRRLRLLRSGPLGLEEYTYAYAESGRLNREEYRLRGQLKQINMYEQNGQRVSEYYRVGQLFLRVTYTNDRPVKEELIEEGRVVRTRELEQ